MSIPKKSDLMDVSFKKKTKQNKIRKRHHSYKVIRCIRAWFFPPWTDSEEKAWLFSYQNTEEWNFELKKYFNLPLRNRPLCLEILSIKGKITERWLVEREGIFS